MKKLFVLAIAIASAASIFGGHAAYAAPTPESCFQFDSATKTITGYYKNEANNPANPACSRDVEISSTIGGVSVESIGAGAFRGSGLTSVSIPYGITSIEAVAFDLNKLTDIIIPDSVTYIGVGAFYNNYYLTNLVLGGGVTAIDDHAFAYSKIANLTLPSNLTSIGEDAFSGNRLASLVIPDGVTSIGDRAFASNQLTALTLGDSVISIGDQAFASNQLTSVTVPNSVTSIGGEAFAYQSASQTFYNDLYSDDPARFQSALDSIILVKLYTADRTNSAGLKDSILVADESIRQDKVWADCDAANPCPEDFNGDGDTNDTFVLGGHIVNPASVTTTYKNQSGAELAPSTTAISSNPAVKAYLAKDMPLNIDLVNGSTADTSSYFRLNQNATLTAPTIAGYSTISPSSPHTIRLAVTENTVDFVYSNLPQPIADVVAPTNGALASTGVDLWVLAGGAVALMTIGAGLLRRRS